MRAAFDDAAAIHHQNLVRIADCRQPVGHDKRCPPGLKARQCRLHLLLGFGIQRRRRLVKKQDRRVFQHRTGN